MNVRVALDAGRFSRIHIGREAPLWWGIAGLIVIESAVFASFIVSYVYLKVQNAPWPPAGVSVPDVTLPTINVGLLLGSGVAMAWAGRGIARGNQRALVVGIWLAVLGACVVAGLRTLQLRRLDFAWDSHAYGSIVWTMTCLHFGHIVAAVLGTAVVGVLAWMGYFDRRRRLAVTVDALYWQFVVIVWIPVYLVLYWLPRLS